jgi:hypothetical protein
MIATQFVDLFITYLGDGQFSTTREPPPPSTDGYRLYFRSASSAHEASPCAGHASNTGTNSTPSGVYSRVMLTLLQVVLIATFTFMWLIRTRTQLR